MTRHFHKFRKWQKGASSIEFSLLAALIALAIVAALTRTGAENGDLWDRWTSLVIAAIQSAIP